MQSPRTPHTCNLVRLLVEGHLVASPDAQIFTVEITADDSEELRRESPKPRPVVWRSAALYKGTAGERSLTIGEVYAVHGAATAVTPTTRSMPSKPDTAKDFA